MDELYALRPNDDSIEVLLVLVFDIIPGVNVFIDEHRIEDEDLGMRRQPCSVGKAVVGTVKSKEHPGWGSVGQRLPFRDEFFLAGL